MSINKVINHTIPWLQQLILLWGITLFLILFFKLLPLSFNFDINYPLAIGILISLMSVLCILEIIANPKSIKESYLETKDKYLNYFKIIFSKDTGLKLIKATGIIQSYQKRSVRVVILPILLLMLGIGYSIIIALQADSAITLLTIPGSHGYFNSPIDQPIEMNQPVLGEFQAVQNNLGMISIKMEGSQPASTRLAMRIREKGQTDWWGEDQRHLDQMNKSNYLFFGFPQMIDSKNKRIEFEIELVEYTPPVEILALTDEEDLEVESEQLPVDDPELALEAENVELIEFVSLEPLKIADSQELIRTHYKYNKQELISNPKSAWQFIIVKTTQIVSKPSFFLSSLVGFVPLFFYMSLLQFSNWFMKEFKTKEDYLSLGLIIYLSLEIYGQLLRLGEAYLPDIISYYSLNNYSIMVTALLLALFLIKVLSSPNDVRS